jgi:sugar/nucleoside kinase (ribokinase family)
MSGAIVAIGDVVLQLISNETQEGAYQRTLIIDAAAAEYGGAAWNVAWNLEQLGWTTRMLAQHGPDAVGGFPSLPVSGREALEPSCRKRTPTDRLLVFPRIRMPAVYLKGRLSQQEVDSMLTHAGQTDAREYAAIVFAGSRHHELRRRAFDVLFSRPGPLRVFSPSYTIYEYGAEELAAFLAHADVAIVNRHEAAFISGVLGEAAVMTRPRIAGIVTRDADGADIHPVGGTGFHLPSTSRVRGHAIGAGDAFVSGFVDEFLRNRNLAAAARLGIEVSAQTARSGLVCAKLDTARARAAAGLPNALAAPRPPAAPRS